MSKSRSFKELYPDFSAECQEIRDNGLTLELLYQILNKHKPNSKYNRNLYNRYMCLDDALPIKKRKPRFQEENPINNQINNDFFSEIVDFKTGYFAGKPIAYGYSKGEEAEEVTGGENAVNEATKLITDFTTRNTMSDVDAEITKFASIYGYAGRLFYIDTEGETRVMPVHGYETIILSTTDITEPEYAIRYFYTIDLTGRKVWTVEFYDNANVITYKGYLSDLKEVKTEIHLFDYCPLQAIPNNNEMLGDAEKVLSEIDDYDKIISDNSNEIESFVHAYQIIENLNIDPEELEKGKMNGTFQFNQIGTREGKMYFLTKDINDAFTEHHLDRLEDNIRHFSGTPNLNDESFGSASGVSLKFKLHPLEVKCGAFENKVKKAAQYMWKVLASAWNKKGKHIDPLQCTVEFHRNFPLDLESEANIVQALITAGLPKQVAFSQLSFVDDPEYIMQMLEDEMDNIPDLDDNLDDEEETEKTNDNETLNQ